MRTLRLLEQHHKKLSRLLKFPTENPVIDATAEKTVVSSAAVSELRSPKTDAGHTNPRRTNAPTIQVPRRMPPRDMSSSIASNLASARGIRSANTRRALSPSVSTQQAPGSLEVPTRRHGNPSTSPESIPTQPQGKPSWVPPINLQQPKLEAQAPTTRASAIPEQAPNSTSDEGFNRFYSTVENLWTKLSAPLAFAGLPLISEESSTIIEQTKPREVSPKRRQSSSGRSAGGEPELTKFISRAALRASAHPAPGNDSFYVVPTTGHTVSYANILSFENKEKRRMAASMHSADPDLFDDPDNDDFVDAHETPMPPSPSFKKKIGFKGKAGVKELENMVEELYIENQSLKSSIDKLSKRLHAFEISAQSSGLALQESMRLLRPASPALLPQASAGTESEARMAAKIKALEEQVATEEREMQRLSKENEKQKTVISRYRERWEKLKEGAKTRREGGKDGQGGPAKDGSGGGRFLAG
jgi:hypothetical protein